MMKRILRIAISIITLLAVASAGGLLLAQTLNNPSDDIPAEGTAFTVAPGEPLGAIARRLQEAGFIRSDLFLKILSYAKGTQSSYQAGTYLVESGMSTLDIHNLLVSGRELLIRVTIPEGWTSTQIAARLDDAGITGSSEFLSAITDAEILSKYHIPSSSAEGFLFPDTYLFPANFPANRIVDVLVGRFFQEVETLIPDGELPEADEFYRAVVLASIIEREYRAQDEAKLMASVFYNRLETDMRLQSCATVAFVLTEELGQPYPEVLTYDDLEIESEYNTYWSYGLPPGPIANPGLVAIDAALHPAQSDYLFFVLKDPAAGRHEFSRSFDEHVTAKNLYIKKS